MAKRRIIAALSPDRVIGLEGRIPWNYPEDLRRFKRLTLGATLIMGRKTFESIGCRPLPGRRNIVVTRTRFEGVECYDSLAAALRAAAGEEVWFIGGRRIYEEALPLTDELDLTFVPDRVPPEGAVLFPPFDWDDWTLLSEEVLRRHPPLVARRFGRVRGEVPRG